MGEKAADWKEEAVYASLPRTTRGLPVVVNCSPDGKKLVYCNGNSVFIKDIEDITKCEIYTEHAVLTTAAKHSPSGFYIASGDQSGKVRIWDASQPSHILKAEYQIISGPIRDIAWSEDSKRVAVVGEGRERYGHVFLFDTGTSNGNMSGQSRPLTTVDIRPARPYRLVAGSEDFTIALFEGPPFKFKTSFHEHDRFVRCIRYDPKGTLFASGGADGKVVLFEGTDGKKVGELIDSACKGAAHSGGIFWLSWSPDGERLATASGDRSVKVWNAVNKTLLKTFTFGKALEDQQLSVVWTKNQLISVNLAGFIHYLDVESGNVTKVLKGHYKPITSFALAADKSCVFTADFEGNITRWLLPSGETERISPNVHKSQVSGLGLTPEGCLISVAWDDTIAFTDNVVTAIESAKPRSEKLTSQPRDLAMSADGKTVLIACQNEIVIYVDQKKTGSLSISYQPMCIALSPDQHYAVVGSQDSKVRVYEVSGNSLKEVKELVHENSIWSVSFSPDGTHFVATDAGRKVVPYRISDFSEASEKSWSFHTARVNCSAWSENSRYIATGGLDTNIMVWDIQNSGEHPLVIKGAHAMSSINGIIWLAPDKLLSVGQDSVMKTWTVNIQ